MKIYLARFLFLEELTSYVSLNSALRLFPRTGRSMAAAGLEGFSTLCSTSWFLSTIGSSMLLRKDAGASIRG